MGVGGSDGHATELSGPYAAQMHACMMHERRNTPQASEASRQAERRTGGGRGLAVKLRAVCVQNVYCPLRRRCAVSRRSCDRGPKCIQVICNVRDNSVLGEPLELLQPCRSLAALHLLVNACWCQQRRIGKSSFVGDVIGQHNADMERKSTGSSIPNYSEIVLFSKKKK